MTEKELAQLDSRIAGGKAFSACVLPGESSLLFDCMDASPWPGSEVDSNPAPSTSRDTYLSATRQTIDFLRTQPAGFKTVLARNISGKLSKFDPVEMVAQYFPCFPDCLRFIVYSPSYGLWMGATPELLLTDDGRMLHTRALAGTRPRGTSGEWSEKNVREHIIVVDDILKRIHESGIQAPSASQTYTLPYGTVEHLCTDIKAVKPEGYDVEKLVSSLHPTPAVCGYPRETAMTQISQLESYPRKLYGGILNVKLPDRKLYYVMLRCVHFNFSRYSIYTGSGLTADSDPDDEFTETLHKADPLINLLSQFEI